MLSRWKRRRATRAELDRRPADLREYDNNAPSEHYEPNRRMLGGCMAAALERVKMPLDIVVDLGYDKNEPGFIVLVDHRGEKYVPHYQTGEARQIARRHNRMLLEAGMSPCWVVNWWYEHHPWLNRQPIELLGKSDPQLLTAAVTCTLQNR